MKKKKNRPNNMQKRNQTKKTASEESWDEMVKGFSKRYESFDENEADNLLEELAEAFKSGDQTSFDKIATELTNMGCSVRINPNNTFTVSFPLEFE